MVMPLRFSRRAFLSASATVTVVCLPSCRQKSLPISRCWRFFTAHEASVLAALCDQIVPPDDLPGAVWAGAMEFIDRQLMAHYQNKQGDYRRGLAKVEASAMERFGQGFAMLSFTQQTELCLQLEENAAPETVWGDESSRDFFHMVVTHTMQAYYGNPRHGGNRDGVGYQVMGLPYPQVRGRHHYTLKGSVHEA